MKIKKKFDTFKDHVTRLKVLRGEKITAIDDITDKCTVSMNTLTELQSARELLEKCNILSREFVKVEVEQLVTQGLRVIFDDPVVKFNIEFEEKRNQTEAVFYLSTGDPDDRIEGDILYSHGGGLVDIISISLRIIIMQLLKLEGPLILDEPGKNISVQYIDAFGKFLVNVSKAFDRQIIMITHNGALANCADNTIEVEKRGKFSKVVQR